MAEAPSGPSSSSDKAAAKKPKKQQQHILTDPFVFVPITDDEAAKGRGAAKQIVRAHVTRIQHHRSGNHSGQHHIQNWTVKPYVPRDSSVSLPPTQLLASRQADAHVTASGSRHGQGVEVDDELQALMTVVPRLPSGHGLEDPFWTYPVDYQPELSPIFAHYVQNVAVEIPDVDGPDERGLLRKRWFPLAMTNPATMYAVLLMAASHYCAINPSQAGMVDLLMLKSRALAEINAGLASKDAATSDAMVGAVGKMAAYEALFGDSDAFASHMKGLQMMIKMRGGLSQLGLDGMLERLLVWIDFNASHVTGLPQSLGGDEFPTNVSFERPDPHHFARMS